MPIYAYRCDTCGFAQDVLRKVSDPPLVACPQCGEPTFRKQVTAAGFQLKGSGWYVTDFRNPASKDAKKPDVPAGGESPGEAAASSDKAPDGAARSGDATDAGSAAKAPAKAAPAAAPPTEPKRAAAPPPASRDDAG